MEFNKPVSNPLLVEAIELLKEADTQEHRDLLIRELLKADLMAPAIIDPAPAEDEEGRLSVAPGSRVQLPMLFSSDGKKFFMGFTDEAEYRKWQEKNRELPFFAVRLQDFAAMLSHRDSQGNECPALGLVINPYGASVMLPRELIGGIVKG